MRGTHRVALTGLSTISGIALLLALKPHHADQPPLSSPEPDSGGGHGGSAPSASGGTRTGTFTGDAVQTKYGPVQVRATLDKGRLTAVKVLKTPSDNEKDRSIAADAVPKLTKEALAAGGAQVHAVSGASYTSDGYARSLQSALDKADSGKHGASRPAQQGAGSGQSTTGRGGGRP